MPTLNKPYSTRTVGSEELCVKKVHSITDGLAQHKAYVQCADNHIMQT